MEGSCLTIKLEVNKVLIIIAAILIIFLGLYIAFQYADNLTISIIGIATSYIGPIVLFAFT